eukprot:TRINITY_DN96448_c0_g1_i1.p1 TRINITY_DN96448_c0_g1~~TRINITY_DN96448_c0_g1_i1.p1  ORF type:complete len:554 (+),score=64.73 TRINITY_DN96448_c0_g1_i1:75-1736(+)
MLCFTILVSWLAAAMGGFPDKPNQQCQDDAGPLWVDDGPTAYYEGFPNAPVLPASGKCPAPLSSACMRKGALAAHMDGPVDCGGKGWFCRITDQPDHRMPGAGSSFPDSNFASCNQDLREGDHDEDGHCHGSDVDDTYGWWVRDHWHRNYAGKLKCCCDWNATIGVVNRCDYRKHVTPEVLPTCRDANEEHNIDWGPGCTYEHFLNYREPPAETCWEVTSFGPGPFDEPPKQPAPLPVPAPSPMNPTPSPSPVNPAPAPSSGCSGNEVMSERIERCVAKPWGDFEGCAKEARLGVCEEPDAWIEEHCCISCGTCSQPTTSEPSSSWTFVDGGAGRACRGSSSYDNSPSYYTLHTDLSLDACKGKCEGTPGCNGIEYSTKGRCEVWTRDDGIRASKAVTGFTCLRFGSLPPVTTPLPTEGFELVDGRADRACRGANANDNSKSYYTVLSRRSGVASLEDCKAACVGTAACQGIEYKESSGRCEVWTRPEGIQASHVLSGFSCYRYRIPSVSLADSILQQERRPYRNRKQAFLGTAFLQQSTRNATSLQIASAEL